MDYGYGQRPDNTFKGKGYFGELKRPDGTVMTEISMGVGLNGKEIQIPLIVPNLSKDEIDHLRKANIKSKSFFDNLPEGLIEKAYEHAVMRLEQGKSPFAGADEIVEPPK